MADITTGLLLHWKLDDGSGTTAADASGQGNDGTFSGAPSWLAGRTGGGVGIRNGVVNCQMANSLNATPSSQNLSLALWLRANAYPSANLSNALEHIINDNGDTDFFWAAEGVSLHDQEDTGTISDPAPVPADGQWHHVAMTCIANSTFKTYVDGLLSTTTANVTGGKFMDGLTLMPHGNYDVDDVRFYGARVLAAEDVFALYSMAAGGPQGLGTTGSRISEMMWRPLG